MRPTTCAARLQRENPPVDLPGSALIPRPEASGFRWAA